MIMKATIAQTKFILKRKEAVCVFLILFIMMLANFIGNVLDFQGSYISEMCHPMRPLLLSYDRTNRNADNTLLLLQIYPLLVPYAAGFSLAREYQRGTDVFLVSRLGSFSYHVSKYLSVFLATMIVFTAPFMMEIVLNCVSFPLSAAGNMASLDYYDPEYRAGVEQYFMKELYLYSPYLYAIAGTVFFGAVSGLFGVFTAAVSSLKRVKYLVFLFLPVFVGLNLSTILGSSESMWLDHLLLFDERVRNRGVFAAVLIAIVLFSAGTVCINKRRDRLS